MSQTLEDETILSTDFEDDESCITSKRARYDIGEEILHKINKLEKNQENLIVLVSRLTEEILLTRHELEKLNGAQKDVNENKDILPLKPYDLVEEFLLFDERLKEDDNSKILIENILRRIAANSSRDFVFKCWRSLVVDSVAREFNWSGQNNKISVAKLTCTKVLQEAFSRKFSTEPEIYLRKTKQFFTYANDRLNKREKYNFLKTEV